MAITVELKENGYQVKEKWKAFKSVSPHTLIKKRKGYRMWSDAIKKECEIMKKKKIMLKLADVLLKENLIVPEERNQILRLIKDERSNPGC